MTRLFLATIFLLIQLSVNSQTNKINFEETGIFYTIDDAACGTASITQDQRLLSILKKHIDSNKNDQSFPGWRVQVYFGSGNGARSNGHSIIENIVKKYPEIKAYLIYEAPFFKVRVGNFRNRNEAVQFRTKLLSSYPNSWIVEDMIDFPPLK